MGIETPFYLPDRRFLVVVECFSLHFTSTITLAGNIISCKVKHTVSFRLSTSTFGIEKINPFVVAITFSKILELFILLGTSN